MGKTTNAIQEKLQQVFGYAEFREEQEAIIQNVLDRKNTFVIMPTGGGKSLCYQIPALMQEGLAIIISPLIALMKNQVDQLRSLDVKAAFLNSTLSKRAIKALKTDIATKALKLLYVAPESLIKEEHLTFLKEANISFIAIDEAHCISDWGHDFRPEYRKIKTVIDEQLGIFPMIALTATATPKVQQDILKNLAIEDATIFKASFNRTNLYYEIRPKHQVEKQLIQFIQEQTNPIGIIYCQSRKKVEEIASLLNVNGIKAAPYHAGLDANTRSANQDAFLGQKIDVIVATIAFGMGIDKPNVRFVVHHDIPRSLEGYYQETGRAGRDGKPSNCLMLYSPEDANKLAKLNKTKPAAEREKAKTLLQEMIAYTHTGVCRRKQLLHYFGETYKAPCNKCDNCNHPTTTHTAQPWITMLLQAIQHTDERFAPKQIIHLLQGKKDDPYIKSYQQISQYGQASQTDETFWQTLIRQTQLEALLNKSFDPADPLQITLKGKKYLQKPYPITLHEDRTYQAQQKTADNSTERKQQDAALHQLLQQLRTKVAQQKAIPEYAVIQDHSLEEMAHTYPTTLEALARISGLSQSKAQKFGKPFIEHIQQYVAEKNITTTTEIVVKAKADRSKNKVYIIQQVDRKIDLEEIAAARSLSMDELIKEMEQICYSGTKLNLDYYINKHLTQEQQEEIHDHFMHATTDHIKEAQKALGGSYEEEELRLLRIKFISEVAN